MAFKLCLLTFESACTSRSRLQADALCCAVPKRLHEGETAIWKGLHQEDSAAKSLIAQQKVLHCCGPALLL